MNLSHGGRGVGNRMGGKVDDVNIAVGKNGHTCVACVEYIAHGE